MKKSRRTLIAVLALCAVCVLALAGAADAKKGGGKKKGHGGGKGATVTKKVNKPIPNALQNTDGDTLAYGALSTPLKIKRAGTVGRVAVTVQTTGLAAGAARDLFARVTSPDGTTVFLFSDLAGQSIGPLTLVPNSPRTICSFNPATTTPPPPPCPDPNATLNPPYLGKAGVADLNLFRGVPMKGAWTVQVLDTDAATTSISLLNTVGISITPQ